jgi:hypothetical protein
MGAFQLSLGRSKDFILGNITFTDANANLGKGLFINGASPPQPGFGGTCNFCHTNAGALAAAPAGQNRNFNTNIEARDHPGRDGSPDVPDPDFPFDGGFGQTPTNPNGSFGNGTFNTASVVEAADTAPFFHNNVVAKLEDEGAVSALEGVVRFYTGPEFNDAARIQANAGFFFTDPQIDQLVDFMRGVNTLQNIDVAVRELKEILDNRNNPRSEQDKRLQTAFEETQDAIDVLTAPDAEGVFASAVPQLNTAQARISQAQVNTDPAQRRALVQLAITSLGAARGQVGSGS